MGTWREGRGLSRYATIPCSTLLIECVSGVLSFQEQENEADEEQEPVSATLRYTLQEEKRNAFFGNSILNLREVLFQNIGV